MKAFLVTFHQIRFR
uniref:Uncharacterized protein n=1 Tax=Arundo donax TaxID=35708 RepID=A0A0A9BUL1_ARUDO